MKSIYSFLVMLSIVTFSFADTNAKPTLNVSPLWIMSEYGWYWGASISGGVIINRHHSILGTADLAPWGGLYMTDIGTNGKENHFGGNISYQYKFRIAADFLKVAAGVVTGFSSIPNIYGTMPTSPFDSNNSNDIEPGREVLWGVGPDLSVELGRKKMNLFVRGRVLFARDYNIALLTNIGVSYAFGTIDTSLAEEKLLKRHKEEKKREIRRVAKAFYTSIGGTASLSIFKSEIPEINGILPFVGGEWEFGMVRNRVHLLYGNFTASYSGNNDNFGGGVGYSYSFVDEDKITLRAGGILGFWYMNTIHGDGFQYEYQSIPYFGGPSVRLEVGRSTPRFFIKDHLLIGKGIFNTITAGVAFDFSRRGVN